MHKPWSMNVLLAGFMLLATACATGTEISSSAVRAPMIHEYIHTAVVVGEPVLQLDRDQTIVEVHEVLWQPNEVLTTTGSRIPFPVLQIGDKLQVERLTGPPVGGQMETGVRYVMTLGNVDGTDGSRLWLPYEVFIEASMNPLVGAGPPLDEVLSAGEGSDPESLRVALVELVAQTMDEHNRRISGGVPAERDRFASAEAYSAAIDASRTPAAIDPLEAYLAQAPAQRQLGYREDLPAGAVDALDLEEVVVVMTIDIEMTRQFWGIGYITDVGFNGPIVLDPGDPGSTLLHLDGMGPRSGDYQIVGWPEPFTVEPTPHVVLKDTRISQEMRAEAAANDSAILVELDSPVPAISLISGAALTDLFVAHADRTAKSEP